MASHSHCRELARRIRRHWSGAMEPDPGLRHYLASALGVAGADRIDSLLKDPDQCRCAGIVDLLLHPDRSLLVDLDDLLEAAGFSDADKPTIAALLETPPWWLDVRADPVLPVRKVRVAPEQAMGLVERIGIGCIIDPALAINAFVPAGHRPAARACLRRRNTPLSRHQSAFLQRFVQNGASCGWSFEGDFDDVVNLVDQLPGDESVCRALARRRSVLSAALDSLADYDQRLRAGTMETVMLQGLRAPYIDGPKTAETLALIDRLCRTICP